MSVVMNEVNIGHNHGYIPKNIPVTQLKEDKTSVGVLRFVSIETPENVCRGKRSRGCISSNKSRKLYTQSKEVVRSKSSTDVNKD